MGSHIRSRLKETKASDKADSTLDMLVADTNSPVKFNTEVGEYQLAYQSVDNGSNKRRGAATFFRILPFTGSPLDHHGEQNFLRSRQSRKRPER